jgi:hypothetical protein
MKWAPFWNERNERKKRETNEDRSYRKMEESQRQGKKTMRKMSTVMRRIRRKTKTENSPRTKQMHYQIAGIKPEIHAVLSGNGGGLSNLYKDNFLKGIYVLLQSYRV